MPGSRPHAAASVWLTEAELAGSGVPAISSSTLEPRWRSSRWARDQRVDALVVSSRPTKATVGGPGGSGMRPQRVDVDAGARNQPDTVRRDAERQHAGAVVGVLHQHGLAGPVEQQPDAVRSGPAEAAPPWCCSR